MHHFPKKLALVSAIAILASCSKSNTTGSPDVLGGGGVTAGGTPITGQVAFSPANFEGEAKFIGPRVNALVGEVYRTLDLIRVVDIDLDPANVVLGDIHARMLLASTSDIAYYAETCTNNGGIITQFIDTAPAGLSNGDRILRDIDNVACTYALTDASGNPVTYTDASGNSVIPRILPTTLKGSMEFTFTSSEADEDNGIYSGQVQLGDPNLIGSLDYEMSDGLLNVTDTESENYNGMMNFYINFSTGEAQFTAIDVKIAGGSASLTAPLSMTIQEVHRIPDGAAGGVAGTDVVEIINGSVVSDISGQQITFKTVDYNIGTGQVTTPPGASANISGPSFAVTPNLGPNEGGILYQGDGSAALARTDGVGVLAITVLDSDGDGIFNDGLEAEPSGWGWYVGGFLSPNVANFSN